MPSPAASTELRDRIIAQRVIPVLRLKSAELTLRAVECLSAAGFGVVEITMTTPGAVEVIEQLAPRLLVGAGTLLDPETARRCIRAGARFVVSPCVVPGLAAAAHESGSIALVGAYTPTEVLAAHRDGADLVKVSPISSGGPEHLRAVHAVFPDILLFATGGIALDSIAAYFAAGATLVGVGNNLVDQKALAAGDTARVTAYARRFLA